jgi:adenine-specific DNA-methyltransferase
MLPASDPIDSPKQRKARGAFFTPRPIADYLADWAVEGDATATVLDPTCGEAVFLDASARQLAGLGATPEQMRQQLLGVDLHEASVRESRRLLQSQGFDGTFLVDDFFALSTPDKLDAQLPYVDAVIGNPPFVRYQQHVGLERKRARKAAFEQGVRLSGLASSWAALLVHVCAFLKPEGRLAMVLPTELLTTGYAEPVRMWLKRRFKAVHLVMFDRLQFADATEKVVLLLARGTGGTNAFSLVPVGDAADLPNIRFGGPMHLNVAPPQNGKWTDLLMPVEDRQLFDRVVDEHFVSLGDYGRPMLGTVTGANDFFCLTEATRQEYDIDERHLLRIVPPGSRHLSGFSFSTSDWDRLRKTERVWLLAPQDDLATGKLRSRDDGLRRYLAAGEAVGVPNAYKCRARSPWYRPRAATPPHLFFTYMSHRYPRLIRNQAKVSFVNSMHGLRMHQSTPTQAPAALPLLMLNAATMLGAEIHGRFYGGGILKMEPREASALPLPDPEALIQAWEQLRPEKARLERELAQGRWTGVAKRVDEAVLQHACRLSAAEVARLHAAARSFRRKRMAHQSPLPTAR